MAELLQAEPWDAAASATNRAELLTAWFPLPEPLPAEVVLIGFAIVWVICVLRTLDAYVSLAHGEHGGPPGELHAPSSLPRGLRWVRHYLSVRRYVASRVRDTVPARDPHYRLLLWMLSVEVTTVLLLAIVTLVLTRYW